MTKIIKTLFLAAVGTLLYGTTVYSANLATSDLYEVVEVDFTGPVQGPSDRPALDIDFYADFQHESGSPTYRIHGFWDGDGAGGTTGNVFSIRFVPTRAGVWTLTNVYSNSAALNGEHQGDTITATTVTATPGFWMVDPGSSGGRWFKRSDGSHPYIVGNTHYDFLSKPNGNEATAETIRADIDDSATYFKKLRFVLFSFRSENRSSILKPFFDTGGNPSDTESDGPNPAFFSRRVDVAVQRGFEQDLIIDLILGGTTGDQIADREGFIKYVAARYGSYPNVWFCIGQEWNEQVNPGHQVEKGNLLRNYLPYPTPVSTHATSGWNDLLNGDWHTHTIRQGKYSDLSSAFDGIANDYNNGGNKPGVNDENGYDPGEADTDDVLEGITGTFLGGGYGTTGHKTASKQGGYFWGHAVGGNTIDQHPSRIGLGYLRNSIESDISFWKMTPVASPADSIFTGASSEFRVLEWTDSQYVLGSDGANSGITAALPNGSWTVKRYDVITQTTTTLSDNGSGSFSFDVPDSRACLTVFTKNADDGKPSITMNAVSGTQSRVVALSGTASDNSTVAKVEVRFDGGPWLETVGTTNWQYDWIGYHVVGNKTVFVEARVTDNEDNTVTTSQNIAIHNPLVVLEQNDVVVAIGDSITAGDAAATDWPAELQNLFNTNGRSDVRVFNEGEGGLSSEEFWQDAAHEKNKKSDIAAYSTIDVAVVMLGHNDTRTDDPTWHNRTPSQYESNMDNIVQWLQNRTNSDGEATEVLVILPVPAREPVTQNNWGFPADFNRVMQQPNGYIDRLCDLLTRRNAAGFSPFPAFDGQASSYVPWRKGSSTLIGNDTIHPDTDGQIALAEAVFDKFDIATGQVDTQPTITTISSDLPTGYVGVAYSDDLEATGGEAPLTWTVSAPDSLPPGLSITGSEITGTPTAAGTYDFTVQVTDFDGDTDQKRLTITIERLAGDLNGDGNIGLDDAIDTLRICVGLNPLASEPLPGDMDSNGRIDVGEAIYILQFISK